MAVLLSPVGGVAAQFFTNAGVPLSGGKIYTYAAGTTTPQATYTTGAGNIQHSNPIILDAAGRVPTGEIWLTDGLSYKFAMYDANNVLIATYDNIVGINSNFVNFVNQQEIQTATAGQTVFTLTTMQYQVGTGNLSVFVDGVNQYGPGAQYAYTETSSTVVTFVSGLHVGASVKFTTTEIQNSGVADASQITYTYPDANAVEESVEDRLAQYVSVKDFGAIGDGVTDDTDAIVNALNASNAVYFPAGTYLTTGGINIKNKSLFGVPTNATAQNAVSIIKLSGSNTNTSLFINGGSISTPWGDGGGCLLRDLYLQGNWDGSTTNSETNISVIGGLVKWWSGAYVKIQNCLIAKSFGFGVFSYQLGYSSIENSFVSTNAKNGIHLEAPSGGSAITSTTIDNTSVNSCRGTAPTGGNGVYIKNGFYCDVNGCVIEDVLCGVYLDGADNRSITVFETHIESTTNGGVYYNGSGINLMLLQNILATAPYFVQTNPQFQTYVAIGNFGLADLYALPILQDDATQIYINNAAPRATMAQVTLTPGTWQITGNWNGIHSTGSGTVSTDQAYTLNTAAAIPSYSGTFDSAVMQGDITSPANQFRCLEGSLTLVKTVTTNTTIYLYGGPSSISSTLSCALAGSIKAVKINGPYL